MKFFKKGIVCFLVIISLSFTMAACDGGDDPPPQAAPPQPVTPPVVPIVSMYGKTIKVEGENVPGFSEAMTRLQEGLDYIVANIPQGGSSELKFKAMLDIDGFTFVIQTGDATPGASADKTSMTMGVEYLRTNAGNVIGTAINGLVGSNAFVGHAKVPDTKILSYCPCSQLEWRG